MSDQAWVGILQAGVHHGDVHARVASLVPARTSPTMYWLGYTNGEVDEGSTGGYFNRPLSVGMVQDALALIGFSDGGATGLSWAQLPSRVVAQCPFGEDAMASVRDGDPLVYFVRAGEGPVKIGTTTALPQRLGQMQTAHSTELFVLGVVPGGPELERSYHDFCAGDRVRGEWFHAYGRVARLVLEATHVAL